MILHERMVHVSDLILVSEPTRTPFCVGSTWHLQFLVSHFLGSIVFILLRLFSITKQCWYLVCE